MPVSVTPRLKQTVKLGDKTIHRIAMAPLTRMRNVKGQKPDAIPVEYYKQRASKNGLLITEATFISEEAGGYPHAPGIHTREQVEAWKNVTAGVHEKEGLIWIQGWALGRANDGEQPHIKVVSSTDDSCPGGKPVDKVLDEEDTARYMDAYESSARNALEAGFDGFEIHGANGYIVDQHLQSVSNKRTDRYGGSLENRARFALEALERVTKVFGQERVGIRFSPWGQFQGMREANPYHTFTYVIEQITQRFPNLGYVHFMEGRDWTGGGNADGLDEGVVQSNDAFRSIIRGLGTPSDPSNYALEHHSFSDPTPEHPTLVLSSAGYNEENIHECVERTGDVIAMGRFFISNPDLPKRVFEGLKWSLYDRKTFYYAPGAFYVKPEVPYERHVGYTDYPTYEEEQERKQHGEDGGA